MKRTRAIVLAALAASMLTTYVPRAAAAANVESADWWTSQADAGGSPPPANVPTGGRSTRETVIFAFLLADVVLYLAWRARSKLHPRAGAVSIYDLPPAEGGT